MSQAELNSFVEGTATRLGLPGAIVGVSSHGQASYSCHGITSIENPVPIDPDTLFLLGSVTKTYTATALMHLIAKGRVSLEAPVVRYVPELELSGEGVAPKLTVLQLLNHTGGLDWGLIVDTGEGDGALTSYVEKLRSLKIISAPGERASYSQAGYNLAGLILERVTGLTYERAIATLVLEPLGLTSSLFDRDAIMTRRFAVGHNLGADGRLNIARMWRRSRGDNPGGGLASSAADQLRWARFHLGDCGVDGGRRVLAVEVLNQMQEPTVQLHASNLGDAIGIGWFLRDLGGTRIVGHSGSANGQFVDLILVPERDYAAVVLSNAGPDNGLAFNQAVIRWLLHHHLGLRDRIPEPLPHDPVRAGDFVGFYANEVMSLNISMDDVGLTLDVRIKPEIRAAATKELPPDLPPASMGLLHGDGDTYVVTQGGLAGQRGSFTRDDTGAVVGVDLAGRLFSRVTPSSH